MDTVAVSVPTHKRRRSLHYLVAGLVFAVAAVLALALAASADLADDAGLIVLVVGGAVFGPVLLFGSIGVMWLTQMLAARRGRQIRFVWIWAMVVGLSLLMIAFGLLEHRPISHFRDRVMDPPPASLANLQAGIQHAFGSGGAGNATMFAFDIATADFERLRSTLKLNEHSVDWAKRASDLAEENLPDDPTKWPAFQGERMLGYWKHYRRPADARIYRSERKLAVVDPNGTRVFLLVASKPLADQ